MVASVKINRLTGAGPTATEITSSNTRANTADAHSTNDTASPIEIPTSGTNYSYWVTARLEATTAPDNLIDNVEWFTDGANSYGTGITAKVGTATGYTQATGTTGKTGIVLNSTNYSTLSATTADMFSKTSAAPLAVAGTTTGTGQFADRVVYQVEVSTNATPGTKPASPETISWRYDET